MPPRNAEVAASEYKDLNLSFRSVECLLCWIKGFVLDRQRGSGRERERERERAWMITSTSSSHSDLNGIQTLMPLTVHVKGAKRIRERLSATWEDAVRNTSLPGSHFFYRVKDCPETNKTLCMDKLDNLESIHN